MRTFTSIPIRFHRLVPMALAALLVGACSGGGSTPVPATATTEPPSVTPSAAPSTTSGTFWLRLTTSQALSPVNVFAMTPTVVITADGLDVVPGAVPAIYPGPIVVPLFARQVSDQGRATIVGWADELGLLSGTTDFVGGAAMPGGVTGRIELTMNGERVTLTGLPGGAPAGDVTPGSPGAFQVFWDRVVGLPALLPAEVGPEAPFTPDGYGILVGPPPEPESGMTGQVQVWPLVTPLDELGGPVMDGSYRCGLVEGADAATLRPALESANQLTQWISDPATSSTYGLTVRPIVAGEHPCAEVFGS
jgi:hypothetical protein